VIADSRNVFQTKPREEFIHPVKNPLGKGGVSMKFELNDDSFSSCR
jgi:hypothetical protein